MIFQPIKIRLKDQQTIDLTFSSAPSLFLTKANFAITSTFTGARDLEILTIDISDVVITLHIRPMFPDNLYLLQLLDVPTQPFEDINNVELSNAINDRNIYFVGVEDINEVRDIMLQNLPSTYDTSEQTVVRDITTTLANEFNTAAITLREIVNDNFISVPVVDETYIRGSGPTDRLKNEGAYKVDRVAKTPTGTNAKGLNQYDPVADPNIPFEIINLRATRITEVVPNGVSTNKFDGFQITLAHSFVIKLISVVLDPGSVLYDPAKFGYALLNANYDRLARPFVVLKNNQVLLSALTNGVFPEPIPGDTLTVVYEYDNTGRRVDRSSVSLFSILEQINEAVPTSTSNFFLEFPNIVSSTGVTLTRGAVEFHVSTIDLHKHPAFLHELVFNPDSLPSEPGEYAINYATGQVFVFGTQTELGTGSMPPVATYFYKSIATRNADYFVSDDGYNVSLNPFSQFAIQPFFISFLYEDVFVADVDYAVSSHVEVLNERVNNKLIADFGIQVNNGPVKTVYQILNETTGETYTPGLLSGDQVFFTGNKPPATSTTTGELAQAAFINDEILTVLMPTTTSNGLLRVFPIALKQHPVLNQRQDGIGSDFNTSLQFTRTDLFLREFYFNPIDSVQLNLDKLRLIGDYAVDYANGLMYLAVSSGQNFDIGHASYAYGAFAPIHPHVLGVQNIGLGPTHAHLIENFDVGFVEDGLIIPKQLNYGYDAFDGQTRVPNSDAIFVAQLQDDFTVYTKYPIRFVNHVFTQVDTNNDDIGTLLTKNLFDSTINSFNNTKIDLKTYVTLPLTDTGTHFEAVIPAATTVVKSIVVIDTGIELLDLPLYVVKYKNLIITSVVASLGTATITIETPITLNTNNISSNLDSLVDIAGNRFTITSITGASSPPNTTGTIFTVSYGITPPITNPGSQILDHNGILVYDHLNIISSTELPDQFYVLHYDVFPANVLIGYQVKDVAGNVFTITDVQADSVVVAVPDSTIVPVIDPAAIIETQALLVQNTPTVGKTTLQLPYDAPVSVNTNVRVGYVPTALSNVITAANSVFSAGGTGMVIDYTVGQFFLDYTHLDDELVVSYEWGDNQLDWSISDTLQQDDTYFVSYHYGASRDGLETNFGSLTNVDFLQSAPLSLNRETYRTAVGATIQAFLKGSTHEAIRLLAHAFTQIDPDIEESVLNQWILGRDPLNLQTPKIADLVFGNGKYGDGLTIQGSNAIQLPGESSMRLSQGTFSTWFRPNWYGNQADQEVVFTLPSAPFSVYYNAHHILPQDVEDNPWQVIINEDSYGYAYVFGDYLEVHNAKSEFTGATPSNDGYMLVGDGYDISSTELVHESFVAFPYTIEIGKYGWNRPEPTLSLANDLDVNFTGYVRALNYVNPIISTIQVANVVVDDGYNNYDAGFYLFQRNKYTANIVLEESHLTIEPPYPHSSPPIYVSTTSGSNVVSVVSGDTSTLSINQEITIGTAYPNLTNVIGFTSTTIIMRSSAATSLTNVLVGNLDPVSDPGTLDGYGEIHLRDKLGTRLAGTEDIRTNGWDRQLLVELGIAPFATGHMAVLGSSDPPLTTGLGFTLDFLDSIIPGTDVMVDAYGNAFEVDHVQLPFVWLKKPSASGADVPEGLITAYRKMAGVKLADGTLSATPTNWSNSTSYSMTKQDGSVVFTVNDTQLTNSYVLHNANNTTGTSGISFGQFDTNLDSVLRVEALNYTIHSVFDHNDIYIGNTGRHPMTDEVAFKFNRATTGVPAISVDKYCAIFTSQADAYDSEPIDEVFVKMKVPTEWTLSDGTNTLLAGATPTVHFSALNEGDLIDIVDAYGMTSSENAEIFEFFATDTSIFTPGHSSILLDEGPELRIALGKRHYLFDVEGREGGLRLYRRGDGLLVAEVQSNNPKLFDIRADISSWLAGQLHHIAMSWKISAPDEADELHLFIDGDEVPNEVSFGSGMPDGYIGQIYQELLTVVPRVASTDGYIVNDVNGSGVFIPTTAVVQPDATWINKTIVINSISLGPGLYLNEPLIVGKLASVVGGTMLFLSQNGVQLDFSPYGPSTPILYGLATSATASITLLTMTNFGVFKNGIELNGPNANNPQFRQVGDTQVIELYEVNPDIGAYEEDVSITDVVSIRTFGLLTQRIDEQVYQFGSLIRTVPILFNVEEDEQVFMDDVAIENNTAFITDLEAPEDITRVQATKILLPRIAL